MTKIFTAVAILQLQVQGLLDIDDPVTDYLPFFEVQYPSESSETVIIRHLLNHSSGLSNNVPEIVGWVHADGEPEWNQTELIREKLPDYAELAYEPGSKGMYTNESHIIPGKTPEAAAFDEMYHGLGWFVVPEGDSFFLEHGGGGPGFGLNMRLYPDRNFGIVLMANGTYLDREGILDLAASLDW